MKKNVQDIASIIGAKIIGEPQLEITAVLPLEHADNCSISFINDKKYLPLVASSDVAVIIVNDDFYETLKGLNKTFLIVSEPYVAYAKVAQLFDSTPKPEPGIVESASVAKSALIGENVFIGSNVVIHENCKIGKNSIIHANTVIGEGAILGDNCLIYPSVSIYHDCQIGCGVIIHANSVIGADGFGYANEKGRWIKIPQVGRVVIGNNVEVGAHTAIDRGALSDTKIGNGVILDNHIHIAHNVEIGDHTAIAGCTAIAGSTKVGKYCTIAGRVSIIGHLTVCDNVHITACTFVNKSIKESGAYSSGTTFQSNKDWQKSAVRFRQLDSMWRQIKNLSKEIAALKNRKNS